MTLVDALTLVTGLVDFVCYVLLGRFGSGLSQIVGVSKLVGGYAS